MSQISLDASNVDLSGFIPSFITSMAQDLLVSQLRFRTGLTHPKHWSGCDRSLCTIRNSSLFRRLPYLSIEHLGGGNPSGILPVAT
jgi:hypothetical protein